MNPTVSVISTCTLPNITLSSCACVQQLQTLLASFKPGCDIYKLGQNLAEAASTLSLSTAALNHNIEIHASDPVKMDEGFTGFSLKLSSLTPDLWAVPAYLTPSRQVQPPSGWVQSGKEHIPCHHISLRQLVQQRRFACDGMQLMAFGAELMSSEH